MIHPARAVRLACGIALWCSIAAAAGAQPIAWGDRAYLNVNVTFQLASRELVETSTPVIYGEPALILTSTHVTRGRLPLDLGGGVRLWRSLGAGVTHTRFSLTEQAPVTAYIPHPRLVNQPRAATGHATLQHGETALHLSVVWVVPIRQRIDVAVSGGPTFMTVSQDVVTSIAITEASPTFTVVTLGEATLASRSSRGVGFHVGADVTYFVTPMAGIGFTFRYTGAAASLAGPGGSMLTVDGGGLQVGMGARIRLK
jgi:hypothetical protein